MGECCAELTYGVIISDEDYQKLMAVLYDDERKPGQTWPSWKEKDDESVIRLEQPYETESYLVTIRKSGDYCNDGATPVKTEIGADWNELLKTFLEQHNVKAETEPSWLLVGHYG